MNKGLLALTALLAFVLVMPFSADAKIEITGAALVSAQDVDFDSTSGAADEDFNFNDPRVNLYINGEVSDKISFNVALWMANDWSHENTRGLAAGTAPGTGNLGGLADAVTMLNAAVTLKDVGGSGFDLKAGLIDIPYGFEYTSRTNNGDGANNDFITNSLLDINGTENGISLAGSFDMGQTSTPLSWEIALMNGGPVTDGNPVGGGDQARSNDDLAWAIRAHAGLMENLTVSASWYTNDNKKDGGQDPLNVGSSFLVQNVNSTLGPGFNPNLRGLVTTAGYDRDMWEVSAKYDHGQGHVTAFWGNIDADTSTSANSREWNYWGAQGRYNFDENSYLAVRYNRLEPDYTGSNNLGEPNLWTVAAGYKLADNAMVKAEWTSFDEGGNGFGNAAAANTNDNRSQDADALTIALGVSF